MFDALMRLIHGIKVKSDQGKIIVYGSWMENFIKDMKTVWGTSAGAKNMFIEATNYRLVFPEFFAPDFYKTLDLIEKLESSYSGKQVSIFKKQMIENTWLGGLAKPHPRFLDRSQLDRFKLKPLPHMLKVYDDYEQIKQRMNLRGILLNAVPGSAKTAMGLAIGHMVQPDYMFFFVPRNAIDRVWKKTIVENELDDKGAWYSNSGLPLTLDTRIFVIHYDEGGTSAMLPIILEFIKKNNLRYKKIYICVDECHNFNEITANRSQTLVEIHKAADVNDLVWMSGTPFKARGGEAVNYLEVSDPMFTPDVRVRFLKIYGKGTDRGHEILSHRIYLISHKVDPEAVPKPKIPEEENEYVDVPNSDRYTLKVVREDMRKFVEERMIFYKQNFDQYVEVFKMALQYYEPMIQNSEQRKDFEQYKKYVLQISRGYDRATMTDMYKWTSNYEKNVLMPKLPPEIKKSFEKAKGVVKAVALVVQGEALGIVLGRRRAECTVDVVKNFPFAKFLDATEKKSLIFSNYVNPIIAAQETLRTQGYKPLAVYGDTNPNLNKILHQFDTSEEFNPLLATYKSLSTAVPILSANLTLFMDQPDRSYIKDQAIARTVRLGQNSQCRLINVFINTGTEPNLTTRAHDIVEWSREMVELLTNSDLSISDMDIMEGSYIAGATNMYEMSPQHNSVVKWLRNISKK